MTTDTPHSETDRDWDRLVPTWVAALRSKRRREGVDGLLSFGWQRLCALAALIDRTAALPERTLIAGRDEVNHWLEEALFCDQSDIADVRDFYQRSAAVIRGWCLARLRNLMAAGTDSKARRRLAGWREFHEEAGRLPADLRAAHDLVFYANRRAEQAAKLLGKCVDAVREDKDVAVSLLRPLFDKASGKT
jgi:hypothetical protein